MANPQKGEVSFEADGKTWTLRYSANALCELEDHLSRGVVDIASELQSWGPPVGPDGKSSGETPERAAERVKLIRLGTLRAVFWAGLRDHHPDIDIRHAGDLLVAAGGAMGGLALVADAFAQAFPEPETVRPPKGGRKVHGTGTAS